MRTTPIPLIILGGADRRPATLPPTGSGKHALPGYKGVDIKVGERRLISVAIERLQQCRAFDPIVIAGPQQVYRDAGISARVVHTDGNFGENIRAGVEALRAEHPGSPLAITTCDILPDVGEFRALLQDYYEGAPFDLWGPLIRTPAELDRLGAFAWKPTYRIRPEPGAEAVRILPGHLVIVDPQALRLDFLYRLFQVAYRSRNRPLAYRRGYMIRQTLGALLAQDLIHLLTFRLPNVTWSVLRSGVRATRKLRDGTTTRAELEDAVRRIFVRTAHRLRFPERRVGLPLLEGLSLAQDIDTVEEAEARGGRSVGS